MIVNLDETSLYVHLWLSVVDTCFKKILMASFVCYPTFNNVYCMYSLYPCVKLYLNFS